METKIIYRKEFIDSIPKGQEENVLNIIKNLFIELEKANFNLADIKKGYFIREIKGRRKKGKIYKFRINNGDRVIFTFRDQCGGKVRAYDGDYVILEYVNHDKQGLVGRNQSLDNINIDIDLKYDINEETDTLEREINDRYVNYDLDMNNYISRIVRIEELANLDDEAIYYLNDEQYECLKDNKYPLFIEGGAGTGKSTIALYKAHQTAMTYESVLYITFSDYLKNEMENSFKILTKKIDNKNNILKNIQFESVIKLFSKYCVNDSFEEFKLMNGFRFKKWFFDTHGKSEQFVKYKIGVDDIWKEIRGVIKGICGKNWISGVYNLEEEISDEIIELLLENKYIKKLESNQYIFMTNYSEISTLKNKKELDSKNKAYIDKIKEIINRKLASSFMITEDEYLDLGHEFTIYDNDERKYIYKIAERYDEFMRSNNYIDDNDLARMTLLNILDGKMPKYDYVIVDEIQDLTEIQIYTLYNLSRFNNNFYMNGDFNQTINPTLFRTNRIQSLFKSLEREIEFIHKEITVNYRNNKGIVNFVNEMIRLRNKFFNENKQLIKGIKDYNSKPILLQGGFENNNELLSKVIGRINIAIVVADEVDKIKLLSYIKENLAVEEEQVIGLVYTVNEIKGLEKKYIICYNLISKFTTEWDYMLNNSIKLNKEKNVTKYRYYFNMFYVAITRAMDFLCFYEEEKSSFYEICKSNLEILDEFDEEKINFGEESDSSEYYKYGQLCEEKEDYAAAITAYKNSGTQRGKRAVDRCKGIIEKRNGNYDKAISFFITAKEYILAGECYEENKIYKKAAECYSKAGEYQKALSLYESINDKEGQRKVLINILNESTEIAISEINASINKLKDINNKIGNR